MIRLSKIVNESEAPKKFSNEVKKHFLEIVSTYNKYQEMMDRKSDIAEIAEVLGGITEAAKQLAINETDGWFDAQTVKRNMSELDKLGNQFDKVAVEAKNLDQRLHGLYEDMGHILSRYYKIGEITEDEMKDRLGMNEASPCWDGYKQVGMKMKGGKEVPNCVPTSESVNEAKHGYSDSKASYIDKHKDEYKTAEKINKGNEQSFYDSLSALEEKLGHPKYMIFLSNALRGYKVDMYKDPKIKNQQEAEEALFLLSK